MDPIEQSLHHKLTQKSLSPSEVREGLTACFVITNRRFLQRRMGDERPPAELDAITRTLVDQVLAEAGVSDANPTLSDLRQVYHTLEAQFSFEAESALLAHHRQIIQRLFELGQAWIEKPSGDNRQGPTEATPVRASRTWTDVLVAGREALLNRLLGVRSDQVLNPAAADFPLRHGVEVAAEIRRAVNAFKATAMDADSRRVDYARLRQSEAYAAYRAECSPQLRTLDLSALTTRQEQLAFWINLYNALVIDAVIAFGVQHSVTEGRAGVLAFFRRAAYNVGGHRFSGEDIEHGILRGNRGHPYLPGPQFGPADPRAAWVVSPPDVRIHFALNCASRSCPPIGVYQAQQIEAQLDLAARNFVAADVTVNPDRGEVHLSHIFRWYTGDFGGRSGVITFLLHHLPDDERRQWLVAHSDSARLVYRPYDWTLNA